MSRRSPTAAAAGTASSPVTSPVPASASPPPLRPPTCVFGCSWLSSFAPGALLSAAAIDAHQSACSLMSIQHGLAELESADRESALQSLERQKQKALLLSQMKAHLDDRRKPTEASEEGVQPSPPLERAATPPVKQEQAEHSDDATPHVRRTTRKRGRPAAETTAAPAAASAPVKLARSSSATAASSIATDDAPVAVSASSAAASSSASPPRSPSSCGPLAFAHAPATKRELLIAVSPEELPLQVSSLTPPIQYAGSKLEVYLLDSYHYVDWTELLALMVDEGLLTRRPPIPANFPAPSEAAASSDAIAWIEFCREAWFKGTARSGGAKWSAGFRWGVELSSEVVLAEGGVPRITTHGVVNTILYFAHLPDSIVLDDHFKTKIEELTHALEHAMESEPAATLRRDEGVSLPGYGRRKNRDGSESHRRPSHGSKQTK